MCNNCWLSGACISSFFKKQRHTSFQIECLPEDSPMRVLMKLSELLAPVVTLLRDPKMCTHKQVIAYGIKSIDVLTLVKSDDLANLMFNAIVE